MKKLNAHLNGIIRRHTGRISVWIALLAAGMAVVFITGRRLRRFPSVAVPEPVAVTNVRVRAAGRTAPMARTVAPVASPSGAVATVCGLDPDTSCRYDARSAALRSIVRRRDLGHEDTLNLMAYVCSTNTFLRPDREAALRNDVLNLLRAQEPSPEGLAEMLVEMVREGGYPPAVTDYCIQHLGSMWNGVSDGALRPLVRDTLVAVAGQVRLSYAGTALYALDADRRASDAEKAGLRRLTLQLCRPAANPAARIAAIQLAGQRGYAEALPILREILADPSRDVVVAIAAAGSAGLLGGPDEIPLLESVAAKGGRCRPAAETALRRIRERMGK